MVNNFHGTNFVPVSKILLVNVMILFQGSDFVECRFRNLVTLQSVNYISVLHNKDDDRLC